MWYISCGGIFNDGNVLKGESVLDFNEIMWIVFFLEWIFIIVF